MPIVSSADQPSGFPRPLDEASGPSNHKQGFTFGYWLLNSIEAGERLAFYCFFPIIAIYIAQADEPGGLHCSQVQKGDAIFWFSFIQALLPIISGGYADRYGFKLTLIISLLVTFAGYATMALQHTYTALFAGLMLVGIGASFFKPAIQGGLARSLSRERSSLGWGIFYWVVNIGALFGHWLSPLILTTSHSSETYRNLFLFCAGTCVLNLVLLFFLTDVASGAAKDKNPFEVFFETIVNIFEPRLLAWLLIMSCFWMMMYQLWDSQPNFIQDWIDRGALAHIWPLSFWAETGADGIARVPQQVLLSLNSLMIVIFVVPVSHFVRKLRSLSAMLGGMFVVTVGMFIASLSQTAWVLLVGIVFFSLGEMLVGPKKSEYLALIAPPGKKALFLGYVMIPTGIGRGLGNWLAGHLYGSVGEKATLALRYLMEKTPLGTGKNWDGHAKSLETAIGIPRTEAFAKLQEVLNINANDATRLLWDHYHPQYYFWLPFVAVGITATIALYIFGRMARRWSDMNA